jgi:hypothetical protein
MNTDTEIRQALDPDVEPMQRCCHGQCEQGRACPARAHWEPPQTEESALDTWLPAVAAVACAVAVILAMAGGMK